MSTSASNDACLEVVLLCMFIPCIHLFRFLLYVKSARTRDVNSVFGLKLYWGQVYVSFLIQCYSLRTKQAYLTCSRCCMCKQPRSNANWAWKVRVWIRVISLSSIAFKLLSVERESSSSRAFRNVHQFCDFSMYPGRRCGELRFLWAEWP